MPHNSIETFTFSWPNKFLPIDKTDVSMNGWICDTIHHFHASHAINRKTLWLETTTNGRKKRNQFIQLIWMYAMCVRVECVLYFYHKTFPYFFASMRSFFHLCLPFSLREKNQFRSNNSHLWQFSVTKKYMIPVNNEHRTFKWNT